MPSTHTHALIAEEVLAALPENVRAQIVSEKEYFAGAQGADVYFFLRFCADTEKNVGKSLHRRGIYKSFSALLDAAREGDAAVRSYAAGYITHYAADTVFHPFVYGTQEKLAAARAAGERALRRVSLHSYIESDLDAHFLSERGREGRTERTALSSGAAEKLYPAVRAAYGGTPFTPRSFRRSFRRFALYERVFSNARPRRRKVFRALETVCFAPHVCSVLCRRQTPDPRCVNAAREQWRNPSDPAFTSHESADELFARAVREGVRLVCAFFIALEGNGELAEADFSKNYLTGAAEGVPLVRPGQRERRTRKKKGADRGDAEQPRDTE